MACPLGFEVRLPRSDTYQFRVNDSRPLAYQYDELKRQAANLRFFNPEQFFDPDSYVKPSS